MRVVLIGKTSVSKMDIVGSNPTSHVIKKGEECEDYSIDPWAKERYGLEED